MEFLKGLSIGSNINRKIKIASAQIKHHYIQYRVTALLRNDAKQH
jgi:hypothetical protein